MSKEQLFDYIRKEKVTIWAGAGFSYYAGYPLAGELRDKLFAKLSSSEQLLVDKTSSLEILAEEFVRIKRGDKSLLYEVLKENFCKPPESTALHEILAGIPHLKNIITTNYDSLFETVYTGRNNVIIHDRDVARFKDNEINIIKIHGDLSFPETAIITKADYSKFYNLDKGSPLWSLVINKISTDVLLFIGYGYEDPNIWGICDHVSSYLSSSRKPAYLIAPGYPDHKIEFLRQNGIIYLDLNAETFLKDLHKNIMENILSDFRDGIVSPDTFRQFLNRHNINPGLSGGENGYTIESLKGLTEPLSGNLMLNLNTDFTDKLKLFFEEGMTEPLEIDDQSAFDIKFHIEGLNVYREGEIAKIALTKKPSMTFQFDLAFPGVGFEINDLSAQLYRGSKKFTLEVHIHNYTLLITGDRVGETQIDVKFNIKNSLIHPSIKDGLEAYHFAKHLFASEMFIVHIHGGGTFSKNLPKREPDSIRSADGYIKYLEHLKKIELYFAIRFRNFKIHAETEELIVRRLVRIIEGKPINLEDIEVILTMSKIYSTTVKMLEILEIENQDLDINFNVPYQIELYGYKFHLTKTAAKVVSAKATNLQDVKNRTTKEIKVVSKTGKILEFYSLENASTEKVMQDGFSEEHNDPN